MFAATGDGRLARVNKTEVEGTSSSNETIEERRSVGDNCQPIQKLNRKSGEVVTVLTSTKV